MTEGIDVSGAKDGGILKVLKKEGNGQVTPDYGSQVTVHYTGTLLNGEQFDSSRGRGEFSFTLGQGEVIKGWDEGVKTMKKGEVSVFTLQPQYAYGENGSPPKIGQNETLVFEIELISWKAQDISEEGDGRLTKSTVKKGQESWNKVSDGSLCTINCKIVKDPSLEVIHDYGNVKFEVGEAELFNLPRGIDFAVKKMQRNEVARIECKLNLNLTQKAAQNIKINQTENILFEVHLKNYEKVMEPWEMSDEEKINQANICKEKGTKRFKEQEFKIACTHYARVNEILKHQEAKEDTEEGKNLSNQFKALKLAANLNLALVYPKFDENLKAVHAATEAIELDKNNEKAFFRRAEARVATKDYEEAKNDFKKVIEINQENKLAAKKMKQLTDKIKAEKDAERKRYAGKLFG